MDTLTEALLVGTSSGDYGHADGYELVAPISGRRLIFAFAVVDYTFADAAYTACTSGSIKYQGDTGGTNASEAISSQFSASANFNGMYTHIDTTTVTTTALDDLQSGNSLIIAGTACTNGASANGTAQVDTFYYVR